MQSLLSHKEVSGTLPVSVGEVVEAAPVSARLTTGSSNDFETVASSAAPTRFEIPPIPRTAVVPPPPRAVLVEVEGKMMLTCFAVADYFRAQANDEAGDLISNMKLQKLMYYAQGFHLALNDAPLFAEPIEAWTYGPVVPPLYHELKRFGAGALPRPVIEDWSIYDADVRELLDEVYDVYGQFSAWKLAMMTHEESPWKDASASRGIITHEALKEFFALKVN